MANFRRDDRGRGRKFFGSSRGDRQMFQAVCSNCGRDCQVPFKPTGDKPIYCSECFGKMGNRDDRRTSYDRPRGNRDGGNDANKAQLNAINAKLDKILNILQPKDVPVVSFPEETPTEKMEE